MAWEHIFDEESLAALLSLRAFVCLGALVADRLFERLSFAPWLHRLHRLHPVALFGLLVELAERRFNRAGVVSRFWRGVFVCGGLVVVAFVAGFLTDKLLWKAGWEWVFAGGIVVCGVLIAHASLDRHVTYVEVALRKGDLVRARGWLSHLVGRETRTLSKDRVARAALESLAENASDGTVAPLLYYLIFGLGGVCAYKAVNTLDSMVGYRGASFGLFGRLAARLDDVANVIPSRLTAAFFAEAAYVLRRCSGRNAFRIWKRDALSLRAWVEEGFVSSPNASHPEAALAGALGVKIGGVREYRLHGEVWRAGWEIGESEKHCEWRDLRRARRLVEVAIWLNFGFGGILLFGIW